MAKGITGGVDIINTLHQKNDVDFYIAWASDIMYNNGNLEEKLDEMRQVANDAAINIHTETIPSTYWDNGANWYNSGPVYYKTNVKYIEIENPDDDKLVLVVPSVLTNDTNNKQNLKVIMEAKFDVIISNNDTSLSSATYKGTITNDIDKKGIFLIYNGKKPTVDISVDIIEIPLNS